MVQLKVGAVSKLKEVSFSFQFQMVQLKVYALVKQLSFIIHVSIPNGSIKSLTDLVVFQTVCPKSVDFRDAMQN